MSTVLGISLTRGMLSIEERSYYIEVTGEGRWYVESGLKVTVNIHNAVCFT